MNIYLVVEVNYLDYTPKYHTVKAYKDKNKATQYMNELVKNNTSPDFDYMIDELSVE